MWAINNNNMQLVAALIQAGSDVKFQRQKIYISQQNNIRINQRKRIYGNY